MSALMMIVAGAQIGAVSKSAMPPPIAAAVIAYGGGYARYRVNERLSLLAADDRAHKCPGIHRRIVHAGADKRREIIIKLVL